jgi:cysteine desulfurase
MSKANHDESAKRIYMDHAATTPVDPKVMEAMLPYFTQYFGNASSLHLFGREAYNAMETARANVARLIGAEKEEIIFTAGGTESDNIAIKGIAFKNRSKGMHIITSPIEHPAVIETCAYLETMGFHVTYVPVDKYGLVDLSELEKTITKETVLISIQHANNEVGTIQNIEAIGEIAEERNVRFHTDAVQSTGKIPIDVKKAHIDLLSMASHKFHGPKGVGALYVRKGVALEPLVHGGGQEKGLRSSTENIPGIVGIGKAAEIAYARMIPDREHVSAMRDRVINGVLNQIPLSYLNGHPTQRLPNNVSLRFDGVEGESLVLSLDGKGIAASTGSACSSKKLRPSHVLLAIGFNEVQAHGSLRLTLGRGNTEEEVSYLLEVLPEVMSKMRAISPLWQKKIEVEKWRGKVSVHPEAR